MIVSTAYWNNFIWESTDKVRREIINVRRSEEHTSELQSRW